jgi:predicted DNA-binding protein YlxM (UPF0122 family)
MLTLRSKQALHDTVQTINELHAQFPQKLRFCAKVQVIKHYAMKMYEGVAV